MTEVVIPARRSPEIVGDAPPTCPALTIPRTIFPRISSIFPSAQCSPAPKIEVRNACPACLEEAYFFFPRREFFWRLLPARTHTKDAPLTDAPPVDLSLASPSSANLLRPPPGRAPPAVDSVIPQPPLDARYGRPASTKLFTGSSF